MAVIWTQPSLLVTLSHTWSALFWGGANEAHSLANAGYNVILSLPEVTYFDHPYEADPREPGNYWAGRYTDTQKVFNFMPENLPANAGDHDGQRQ
ncbi:family 20 glycosylhydrolase [Vibrio sp. M60_M31a]